MSVDNVVSIIVSILGSSVISLMLSTFIFLPMQKKRNISLTRRREYMNQLWYLLKLYFFQQKQNFL